MSSLGLAIMGQIGGLGWICIHGVRLCYTGSTIFLRGVVGTGQQIPLPL